MNFNLTDGFVKKADATTLNNGPLKQTDYYDDPKQGGVGGLFLRVLPNGRKSFNVRYRLAGAKRAKNLGGADQLTVKQARKLASDAIYAAKSGVDPAGRRDARGAKFVTFGKIAENFIEKHAKKTKRSWQTDQRYINVELAAWKDLPATSIGKRELTELLDAIIERGSPSTATHVRALIETIFNKAIGWGDVEMVNPAYKYELSVDDPEGARALSDDEVRRLWTFLDTDKSISPKQRAFVKLCLVTGARAREVLQCEWKEIDFEMGVWTLPAARNKRKKYDFVCPLSPIAMDLIESLKADNGTPWLFPRQDKSAPMSSFSHWFDGSQQKKARVKGLRASLNFVQDWTCHSLRKTCVSGMAALGIAEDLALRSTNHTVGTAIGLIYNKHEYLDEKRAALTNWADRLKQIVESSELNTAA